MKRVALLLCFLMWLNAVSTVAAQGFYPDFALVVQLPSYETFMTNLGNSPIRIDYYEITSQSGSLSPSGWKRLSSAGPEIVAALGPGADEFFALSAGVTELREGNLGGSATWQPGQSWSIGFPFNSAPGFARDAVFRIASPDGLLLTGGTVVSSPDLAPASLLVIPEPPSGVLCLFVVLVISAICPRSLGCREKKSAENRLRLRLALLILTFAAFQCFPSRSAALPVVEDTGQYTDRHRPTLPDPVIPAGDHLLIYALIETTDLPGSPTIAVSAKQGDTILTLKRYTGLPNEYLEFIDFDPNLTGAWEIVLTDSTGTGPSAFTNALAEPEFLPYVESITLQGSPRGASVEWTLPDLTGFDVERVQVRIVQATPRSSVFLTSLPFPATSFEPPSGLLQYGVEYVYGVGLIDDEGFYTENRSVAQSQPFRFALAGDFNVDGAVDAADYVEWRKGLGTTYDQDDYGVWRAHFGASLGPGSGSAGYPLGASADPLSAAAPEPATLVPLIVAAASNFIRRHREPARVSKLVYE